MTTENAPDVINGDVVEGVFVFKNNIPAEVLPVVREHFLDAAWLVPPWCQLVAVHWNGDGHPEAAIETRLEYEYRWACITVYPGWLDSRDEIRREGVLHEMLHLSVNVLWDYACETIETLIKEDAPKFHATVEKELRRRLESAVQDLAYLIERKTRDPQPVPTEDASEVG